VVARLAPGATVAAADAELRALGARLAADHPAANRGRSLRALALRDAMTPPEIRLMMAVMLGAVTLVLCVACANVANLMLGAGVGRARETAVRTALGASRWRVARPLLVESVVLGLAGAAAGVLLAAWGLRATLASFPFQFPPWLEPTIDRRVVAYTMALGLASGVLFGLLPALRAAGVAPGVALQSGGRGATAGPTRSRVRDALVAVQLSLSLVLLVAAALMMKSFVLLQGVEPGYAPEGVLAVRVSLTADRFDVREARLATLARLRDRFAELPGVVEAAAAPQPPTAAGGGMVPLDVAGLDVPEDGRPWADVRPVVGAYLGALRVPLVAGRAPTFAESLDSTARVAVVSEGMARRVWPGESPLGRTVAIGGAGSEPLVVVGVAADARQRGLARAPANTLYLPYASRPTARTMTFLLRTRGDPGALAAAARGAVAGVDPGLAVLETETLTALLDQSLWHERLFGRLFTAFGAAALVLALVGLYGVVAHATGQRTHEIGVRVALGARAADVRRLVLAGSARVVGASLLAGLVLAAALGRALASMLYGVSTTDLAVYAGATLALAAAALLAAWLPARRAARVDPVVALRAD
jgi:predicted permease